MTGGGGGMEGRPPASVTPKNPAPLPSSPSILLSSALCRSGFCTAKRFLSSFAHTMKAFMGRRMRLSLLFSPGGQRGGGPGDNPSVASPSSRSGQG